VYVELVVVLVAAVAVIPHPTLVVVALVHVTMQVVMVLLTTVAVVVHQARLMAVQAVMEVTAAPVLLLSVTNINKGKINYGTFCTN